MLVRRVGNVFSVTALAVALLSAPATLPPGSVGSAAQAAAAPCPQVEVIFARGRVEPPGNGRIGDVFIDALRARTDKVLDFYSVNYLADIDVIAGANDMSRRIQYMANNCPDTRLVLGGYSLGAAVTDVVMGAPSAMFGYTSPLPLGMDSHVAAVVLFGNGTQPFFGPVAGAAPEWGGKTIDLCTDTDPICSGTLDPNDAIGDFVRKWSSHLQDAYIDGGLVNQGADFAAARL